jgi:hypothetical protein
MANRITFPRLQRPTITIDWDRLRAAPEAITAWRPPRGRELWLLLYQIASAPFWLFSGIPSPKFPSRDAPLPPGGLAGDHVGRNLDLLARKIWIQRIVSVLLRVAWLPLLADLDRGAAALAGDRVRFVDQTDAPRDRPHVG